MGQMGTRKTAVKEQIAANEAANKDVIVVEDEVVTVKQELFTEHDKINQAKRLLGIPLDVPVSKAKRKFWTDEQIVLMLDKFGKDKINNKHDVLKPSCWKEEKIRLGHKELQKEFPEFHWSVASTETKFKTKRSAYLVAKHIVPLDHATLQPPSLCETVQGSVVTTVNAAALAAERNPSKPRRKRIAEKQTDIRQSVGL